MHEKPEVAPRGDALGLEQFTMVPTGAPPYIQGCTPCGGGDFNWRDHS